MFSTSTLLYALQLFLFSAFPSLLCALPSLLHAHPSALLLISALLISLRGRLPKALNGVRAGGWVHTVADAFDAHEKKYVLFIFASVRA